MEDALLSLADKGLNGVVFLIIFLAFRFWDKKEDRKKEEIQNERNYQIEHEKIEVERKKNEESTLIQQVKELREFVVILQNEMIQKMTQKNEEIKNLNEEIKNLREIIATNKKNADDREEELLQEIQTLRSIIAPNGRQRTKKA